jgi:DNA-binding MarR family transcriptional regulator
LTARSRWNKNLITRVLDESAALAREPEFLLHEELRDLVPYHSVLMALAQGKSSPAQLAKSTGIDVRGLNYHLNTLVELGYVQRRYPNARNATIGRRLFVKTARARAKARHEGICVHTLQELYDLDEVS